MYIRIQLSLQNEHILYAHVKSELRRVADAIIAIRFGHVCTSLNNVAFLPSFDAGFSSSSWSPAVILKEVGEPYCSITAEIL